jgi:hypothetical protein
MHLQRQGSGGCIARVARFEQPCRAGTDMRGWCRGWINLEPTPAETARAACGLSGGSQRSSFMSRELQAALVQQLGVAVKLDWLQQCCQHLRDTSHPGLQQLPPSQQLQLVLGQLLFADLHSCGEGGIFPETQVLLPPPILSTRTQQQWLTPCTGWHRAGCAQAVPCRQVPAASG